jgi:hypothetical protein
MSLPLQFDDVHRGELVDSSFSLRSRKFLDMGLVVENMETSGRQDVRNAR